MRPQERPRRFIHRRPIEAGGSFEAGSPGRELQYKSRTNYARGLPRGNVGEYPIEGKLSEVQRTSKSALHLRCPGRSGPAEQGQILPQRRCHRERQRAGGASAGCRGDHTDLGNVLLRQPPRGHNGQQFRGADPVRRQPDVILSKKNALTRRNSLLTNSQQ
jgi:hypothetical protein